MLFFVSKKEYKALDKQNTELLNIIIQKNKSIEGQEKDIDLLKIENKRKDRDIRGLELVNNMHEDNISELKDSNKLHIDRISELEKELAETKKTHSCEVKWMRRNYSKVVSENLELIKNYKEELNKREEAEANLSKAIARNMVDDMTIKELEHYTDKLESGIEILKTNIETSQEMKRQILDFLELKDEKGNRKIEKGCVLVHSCVSGEYIWRIARLI